MTFTPEQLRVLKHGDRCISAGRHGRPRSFTLGRLSQSEAMAMHNAGASRMAMAEAAGVHVETVSDWRRRNGIARPYNRGDEA